MKVNWYIAGGIFILLGVIIFVIIFTMNKTREGCIIERKNKCAEEENKDYIEPPPRTTIITNYKPPNSS